MAKSFRLEKEVDMFMFIYYTTVCSEPLEHKLLTPWPSVSSAEIGHKLKGSKLAPKWQR